LLEAEIILIEALKNRDIVLVKARRQRAYFIYPSSRYKGQREDLAEP